MQYPTGLDGGGRPGRMVLRSWRPVDSSPAQSWTSPGDVVDAPRVRSTPTIFDDAAPARVALRSSPVARLQPRTIGQLLDGGFEVVRFRFRTIGALAAVIVLPLYAIPRIGLGLSDVAAEPDDLGSGAMVFADRLGSTGWSTSILSLGTVATVGLMVASMLMGVAVTHLVTGWLAGADPTLRETLGVLRSRAGVTAGAFVLAFLAKIGIALVTCTLGLLWLLPALSVLAPVIAAEGTGARASLGRAFRLTHRRFWPVLGVSALWAMASSLVTWVGQGAVGFLTEVVGASLRTTLVAMHMVEAFASGFLLVVQVAVTVLVYLDLRVRTEGLDLELELSERFAAGAR